MTPAVLGLDIGGANLKAAHSAGGARSLPFALWKNPRGLTDSLALLLRDWPVFDFLGVTMTGELCDCFESKSQGVDTILQATAQAVSREHPRLRGEIHIWLTDSRFVELNAARATPLLAAASNWLALAVFVGRFAPTGPALLLDVGSTTTDIVPLLEGRPVPQGRSDPERLRSGELVYTGIRRTPLCALLSGLGAAELFATTLDVYLTLGQVREDPSDCDTADGRPATRRGAASRLARMLCADLETSTEGQRQDLALRAAQRQVHLIIHAVESVAARLPAPPETVVVAGSGEFLAQTAWQGQRLFPPCPVISLAERLGPGVSQAACAYALAILAAEQMRGEG
jgi:probable H4MPT-linked C1 transfer pathway protein